MRLSGPRKLVLQIILPMLLVGIMLVMSSAGAGTVDSLVSSQGSIRYSQPFESGVMVGWGGKLTSKSMVDYYVDMCQTEHYSLMRYEAWGVTDWLPGSSSRIRVSFDVLDYLIDRCESLNITVVIDPVHNYPAESGSTTMQEKFTSNWLPDLRTVATRYNGRSNVILECANEYTKSDAMTKYQAIVDDLRGMGINLPLHFTYHHYSSGFSLSVLPDDPLGKISCGRHYYVMQDSNDPVMMSGETWLEYCQRIGVESDLKNKFTGTNSQWFGPALKNNRTLICTEIGASYNWKYTRYNVAWCMRFLEYCKQYGVGVTMFRIGYYSGGQYGDKQTYDNLAQSYFGRPFYST